MTLKLRRASLCHPVRLLLGGLSVFAVGLPGPAAAQKPPEDLVGETQVFSNEAALAPAPAQAVRLMSVAPGLKLQLWASEPLLANPVSFAFDERGRAFVVETYRHTDGALDNRRRLDWISEKWKTGASPEQLESVSEEILDREIANRTVADREAMINKFVDPAFMAAQSDRVKLVEDRDRDGTADHAQVFATGFGGPLEGVAAGVLARGGDVFFTNIPNVWRLRDTNGDGRADVRDRLSTGYGVRYAFIGHDLHGLRIGPDGRLYYSIGDRGAHVPLPGGKAIAVPESGAVFRCELDGSRLELYATGLRNPQELTFDTHGNLFTGENNSDGGDRARWVHVVEGGDSGWRVGFQFLNQPRRRGPWNSERMWHTSWEGQPGHIVPPVALIGAGPAGVAYYPGTGLGKRWDGHFFMVDFRGGQANVSGIHAFTLTPQGVSFTASKPEPFVWGVLATDFDFGPDGAGYISDWVQGWPKPGKGRIWKVFDPALTKEPDAVSTRRLLGEGMGGKSPATLASLLGSPDLRVRQEAQLALAGQRALAPLQEVARRPGPTVPRLHAVWGLGQIARDAPVPGARAAASGGPEVRAAAVEALLALLSGTDPEVRAQAAIALGEAQSPRAGEALTARLQDESPRVRFFSAIALGKLGRREAVPAVLDLLRANGNRDPFLRHAAVMALAGAASDPVLMEAARDPSAAVRLAVALVWRRQGRAEIGQLLADSDPLVVREAARAINDERIEAANSTLAALVLPRGADPTLSGRVVNANYRLGDSRAATRLSALAGRGDLAPEVKLDAVTALGDWAGPAKRDRVTGAWRPLPTTGEARDPRIAASALGPRLPRLLARSTPDSVRLAAIQATEQLGLRSAAGRIRPLALDRKSAPAVRLRALQALAALKVTGLAPLTRRAASDPDERVRLGALRIAVTLDPSSAPTRLQAAMRRGTNREKQVAIELAGALEPARRDGLMTTWMDALLAGSVPADLHLDVVEAARRIESAALAAKIATFEERQPKDELGPYRLTLAGGEVERGRNIFFNRPDASCMRCHTIEESGSDTGPDLSVVARTRTREQLLEAVVFPSKEFAPGFESVLVTLTDGSIHGGVVKKETAETLELLSPDGPDTVKKASIRSRERGGSGMPDGYGQILSRRDLRDLVAFLASLR